jgi:hypothetical protein
MRPGRWITLISVVAIVLAAVSQIREASDLIVITLTSFMIGALVYSLCPCCCRVSGIQSDIATHGGDTEVIVDSTRTGVFDLRERNSYLDALKVFLTSAVIVHHAVGAFSGNGLGLSVGVYLSSFQAFAIPFLSLEQAYFMALFFFISALFVPASLERKGVRAFLADKALRLVAPMLAMFWVLYPGLMAFSSAVIANTVRSVLQIATCNPRPPFKRPLIAMWLLHVGSGCICP